MAVGRGGIVPKEQVPAAVTASKAQAATAAALRAAGEAKPGGGGMPIAPAKLCVEDPLTGRDVAGGTNRIHQVWLVEQQGGGVVGEQGCQPGVAVLLLLGICWADEVASRGAG